MPYKYTVNDSNVSCILSHPKFLQLPNFFPDGIPPCLSVQILQDQLLNSVILNGPYHQCILILSLPGSSALWSFYCAFKDTTLCRDLLLTFKSTVVLLDREVDVCMSSKRTRNRSQNTSWRAFQVESFSFANWTFS